MTFNLASPHIRQLMKTKLSGAAGVSYDQPSGERYYPQGNTNDEQGCD